jgi:hypothetical protein
MIRRYFFQYAVEVFSIFADDRFFEEHINGHLQLFSLDAAWAAHASPGFVVYHLATLCLSGLYWVKMAADGLFPTDLAVVISLFDAALDDALVVPDTISTHFAIDGRCHPAKLAIVLIPAAAFYFPDAGWREIGFHYFVRGIELVELGFFQRCPGVAVFAAAAFAFQQIANELFPDHVVTYQNIINGYHAYKYSSFTGWSTWVLPAESIDQMIHVLLEKLIYNAQGVFVRSRIKVQGGAEEVMAGIRHEELVSGGGITPDLEEDPSYSIAGFENGVFDRAGLIGMFEGQLVGVVAQFVELVRPYCFIADIDACAKAGEIDIYPPGVLRQGIEIGAVLQDVGIDGIFEGIRKAGLIKGLVLMRREIDPKITTAFGSIDRIAGIKEKAKKEEKGGSSHCMFRIAFGW